MHVALSPEAAGNGSGVVGSTGTANGSTPWGSEEEPEDLFRRSDIRISLILAYSLVFCCCFFGNLLVVIVVVMHRRMRTITNFFLTNLAIADLCVGIFCVYQNLSIYLMDEWPFGDFLCRMYFFVQALSYTASVGILTVICVERYIAIVHPMWSKHVITLRRLRMVVFVVWLVSACFCSPRLFMCGTEQVPSHTGDDTIQLCITRRFVYDSRLYDVLNFVVCFFLPLVIMSVMYFIIGLKLWKSSVPTTYSVKKQCFKTEPRKPDIELTHIHVPEAAKEVRKSLSADVICSSTLSERTHSSETLVVRVSRPVTPLETCSDTELTDNNNADRSLVEPSKVSKKSKSKRRRIQTNVNVVNQIHQHYQIQAAATVLRARRKVIRLLVAVVLGFAVCNLPFHARKFYQYWSSRYDGASHSAVTTTIATTLVLYMNSFINPILYAFLSDNFRKSMKDVLLCRAGKRIRRLSSNRSNGRTSASYVFQHETHAASLQGNGMV
ncbi:trissin receptor-like [Ornithodoros turicata]